MPLRIGAQAFNSVQIYAPFRAFAHGFRADGREWDLSSGIPDSVSLINMRFCVPAGSPGMVVALMVQVDCKIDPIAGRRDFEFTVMANVGPVVSEKHFDHIAVPESDVRGTVVGRQE